MKPRQMQAGLGYTAPPVRASLSERLHDQLERRAWPAIGVLAAVTLFFGWQATRVDYDNSYRIWFLRDDPDLARYQTFLDRFGSDEAAIVTLTPATGDITSDAVLHEVERLSREFERHPEVKRVWSLTRMDHFVDAGGALAIQPLLSRVPPPREERARLRTLLRGSPLYAALGTPDLATTALLMTLQPTGDSFDPKAAFVRDLQASIARLPAGIAGHIAGAPAIDEALYRLSETDVAKFIPITLVVIVVMMGWLFRSALAVAITLGLVLTSLVWAWGLLGLIGWKASIVSTILPSLLLSVGVANAIHVLNDFRHDLRLGMSQREAARHTFVMLLRPCFLTTLTTAAGMLSLVAATLQPLREFGVAGAFGVLASFLLTMIPLPLVLARLPPARLRGLAGATPTGLLRMLEPLATFGARGSWGVIGVSAMLLAFATAGAFRLQVGASVFSYFYESDPVMVDSLAVDEKMGGTFPLQIVVTAPEGKDLLDPEALRAIERAGKEAARLAGQGRPLSFLDMLREAQAALLGADEPGARDLPTTREQAAQVLLMMEGSEDLPRFLTPDRRHARIHVPLSVDRWEELLRNLPALDAQVHAAAGDAVDAHIGGLGKLMANMERYVVQSQISSFGLSFAAVLGLIAIFFRSWRLGLIAALPNLPPLLLMLGAMGWLGIRLDPGTVMIAPILLGLIDDDTIHLFERVVRARARGVGVDAALEEGIRTAGPALLLTAVILAGGFMTTLTGSFRPNVNFGVLSAFAIVAALSADLLLLPAVSRLLPWLWPKFTPKIAPEHPEPANAEPAPKAAQAE